MLLLSVKKISNLTLMHVSVHLCRFLNPQPMKSKRKFNQVWNCIQKYIIIKFQIMLMKSELLINEIISLFSSQSSVSQKSRLDSLSRTRSLSQQESETKQYELFVSQQVRSVPKFSGSLQALVPSLQTELFLNDNQAIFAIDSLTNNLYNEGFIYFCSHNNTEN